MIDTVRYAIGDLAQLGGVSRRTVRYYVQEGLLPPPLGLGRGNHYGQEHLDQLLRVKALQEAGRSLDEIKRTLGQRSRAHQEPAAPVKADLPIGRSLWRRLELAEGVELHIASHVRLPSAARLNELVSWCREHFHPSNDSEDSNG